MNYPPKCSKEWTTEERSALAAWISELAIDRIQRDNPAMPVLAKSPIYEMFRTIRWVLTASSAFLEENREALEKPYDKSKDHYAWLVAGDPSALLNAVMS
jgi:hypothetical protein